MKNRTNNYKIRWAEPKNFDSLKRKILYDKDKSFIIRNWVRVLAFILIFLILMFYWRIEGKLVGVYVDFFTAILITFSFSLIAVILDIILYKIFGYCIITLNDDYIYYDRSGRNLRQWKIKHIKNCKIITGVYKGNPFKVLILFDIKNNKNVLIINKSIDINKVCSFLKNKEVECTIESVDTI